MQPLRGGLAPLTPASKAPSYSWWQASGAIPDANIKEHVELPSIGQNYAGGTLSGAWTIAVKSAWPGAGNSSYVFDAQTGRVILGYFDANNNGFQAGASFSNIGLFADTNTHVYFLLSDGTNVQAYRDNVAVGSSVTGANDIGGVAKWRTSFDANATRNWENEVPRAAIYSIALDVTQRAALYTSMTT